MRLSFPGGVTVPGRLLEELGPGRYLLELAGDVWVARIARRKPPLVLLVRMVGLKADPPSKGSDGKVA